MGNWTTYQIGLAFLMLITGSINTLSTKWADNLGFDHPFLQAVGMFMGELSCLIVFNILFCRTRLKQQDTESLGNQKFNRLIFLPASLCDMCGTSVMYIALNLTYASSFQMLRGAVMIFTALLSVAFLGRKIYTHMWLGMALVVLGLVLVGVADIVFHSDSETQPVNNIITGDLLIIMAQIIVACQMVYEEKVVNRYNVAPLQAVGWEGFFGFILLGLLLIPFYYIHAERPFTTGSRLEDVPAAFREMGANWQIILASIGNIVSIAFFNFSGISVTKEISATTRMVLDSCRTVIIWVVSLAVKWQPFTWQSFLVQLAGFITLIIGMCIYNDLVFAPALRKRGLLKPHCDDMSNLLDEDENDYGINTSSIGDQMPSMADASSPQRSQPVNT